MLNDVKGYAKLSGAVKTARLVRSHSRTGWEIGREVPGVQIRIVCRSWSDSRFVVVVCCESPEALQFGCGLVHALPNVYVTNLEWLDKEVAEIKMDNIQRALFRQAMTERF